MGELQSPYAPPFRSWGHMLRHHPPRAPERAFWSWRQVLRLRDRWECCSPGPGSLMRQFQNDKRRPNKKVGKWTSVHSPHVYCRCEMKELRGDLQGRVPTGQPRGPRKLRCPWMGRRPRRERSLGRIREQQAQSRVERTNVKMATHKDQSCVWPQDCGVCV